MSRAALPAGDGDPVSGAVGPLQKLEEETLGDVFALAGVLSRDSALNCSCSGSVGGRWTESMGSRFHQRGVSYGEPDHTRAPSPILAQVRPLYR